VTARRLVINVLIFVAVIIVMTALAIWLNLGPVASSAASAFGRPRTVPITVPAGDATATADGRLRRGRAAG